MLSSIDEGLGRENGHIYTSATSPFCCSPETTTTLLIWLYPNTNKSLARKNEKTDRFHGGCSKHGQAVGIPFFILIYFFFVHLIHYISTVTMSYM